jgi:rhodanese-related sulfurtransferase
MRVSNSGVQLLLTLAILASGPQRAWSSEDQALTQAVGRRPSISLVSAVKAVEPSPIAKGDMTGGSIDADSACLADASALVTDKTPVLIDVRTQLASEIVWIPGAAHFSLAQLQSSVLVKASSNVVLIGDGKDTGLLLDKCTDLHKRGLAQIRVLKGGLPAWRRAGGSVAGATQEASRPLRLSARELDAVLHQDDPLILFVDVAPSAAWLASSHQVVRVGGGASPRSALGKRKHAMKDRAAVIVLTPGTDSKPWRDSALSLGLNEPMFYLDDASSYDTYLNEQAMIAAEANKPAVSQCVPD